MIPITFIANLKGGLAPQASSASRATVQTNNCISQQSSHNEQSRNFNSILQPHLLSLVGLQGKLWCVFLLLLLTQRSCDWENKIKSSPQAQSLPASCSILSPSISLAKAKLKSKFKGREVASIFMRGAAKSCGMGEIGTLSPQAQSAL